MYQVIPREELEKVAKKTGATTLLVWEVIGKGLLGHAMINDELPEVARVFATEVFPQMKNLSEVRILTEDAYYSYSTKTIRVIMKE